MARNLDIKILVDHLIAKKNLAETEQAITNVGKAAEKTGGTSGGLTQMESTLSKLGKAVGGVAALDKAAENIIRLSGASVGAAAEQEAALKRLETALKAQGVAVPETMKQYEQMATTFQRTTVNSDELINNMQALLVQVGGVMPDQMQAALDASTKLSAGLGIDLETATRAVARAFEGGGTALTRLLPSLKDLIKDGASTSEVLDAINARFGDAATAQMDTYEGKVARLKNQWGEFEEKIGNLIISVLDPLLTWFLNMPESIQNVGMGLGGLTAILAPLAAGVELLARLFGTSLIPLLARALPAAIGGLEVLLGPAGWFLAAITSIYLAWKNWDTIGPMVKRIYEAVRLWLVDKFRAVVDTVKGYISSVTNAFKEMYDKVVGNSYVPDMMLGIGREFKGLDTIMVGVARTHTQSVTTYFEGMFNDITKMATSAFGGGGGGIFGQIMSGGLGLIFGPGGIVMGLISAGIGLMISHLGDFFRWAWDGLKSLGHAIGSFLGLGPAAPPPPGQPTYPSDPGGGGHTDPGGPGGPVDVPDVPNFAMGGVMPFTGMARLHAGEGVLNPSAMSRLGKSGLDALNRGGGAITVNVNVTGGVIDDVKTQRQLAAIVTQAMDQNYRLRRKVSAR